MATAEIQVYASFPRTVAPGADLDIDPSNWHWVHCLTLPIETLNAHQFSHRPYKWIRYAIGIVVGAEGDLSPSPDLLNPVDYNAALPAASAILYYHTSDTEKRRMFPVDPDIGRTTVTSSAATSRRAQFRDEVVERDGKTCVLTGLEEKCCRAVHLLAHSKGDAYITTYTQHRSRDITGNIIEDIDNVRNGLFLNGFTHGALGDDVAFLTTPNFALNTDDVDPTALPATKRCTTHLFQPNSPSLLGGLGALPSGSPLRMSDTPEWPPAILFDAVYAAAVLHHFGTQALNDDINVTWKNSFYPQPGGDMAMARADFQNQARERRARYEARRGPDAFDMLMILPYILVPPNELQDMLREAEEKKAAAEQRCIQEKVDAWNRQITSEI